MPQAIQADALTARLGTDDCRHFRQHVFSELAPIAIDLALRYKKTTERSSYEKANQELLAIHNQLNIGELNLCAPTDELKNAAKRYAEKCLHAQQKIKNTTEAYSACLKIVESYRISPPAIKNGNISPALNRMSDWRWWFRKIKTLRIRSFETVARNVELVNRLRSSYASDYTVNLKRKQKEANRHYLSSTFACNEQGERFSLQDLANCTVSNPAIRRGELMVRIKGFEIAANLFGHVGEFYTLTTPSRMHASLHNGLANPRFDGTTTLQAHEYLTHLWALIRAELHRQNIRPYGFRVVEPHHDGTPHWHLLLFMPPEHRQPMREIMQNYALADSSNEPGAKAHRFKAIAIDPIKGTAAGYIAKYVAKNIDGKHLEQDLYGNEAHEAAERITAWANTWGIRQFQQIGGPSVTVWRQLRRLGKTDDSELEAIRTTATASDWAAFMLAMGGYEVERRDHAIKPFYGYGRQLNLETGEIIPTLTDRYGNEPAPKAIGIIWKNQGHDTRKHFWTTTNRDSETVREGAAFAAPRPASSQLSTTERSETLRANPHAYPHGTWAEPLFLDLYQ
ncbi:replication endonuclease [Methylosoma difficile]